MGNFEVGFVGWGWERNLLWCGEVVKEGDDVIEVKSYLVMVVVCFGVIKYLFVL